VSGVPTSQSSMHDASFRGLIIGAIIDANSHMMDLIQTTCFLSGRFPTGKRNQLYLYRSPFLFYFFFHFFFSFPSVTHSSIHSIINLF
jgi:hypothetical protein